METSVTSCVTFAAPSTRTLVFENPLGVYPVNQYQSLVLANAAYVETLEVSAFSGQPLSALTAIEICCGGGPAAITLKDAGVGFVGASDIQMCSIEQLRDNAIRNHLDLDSVRVGAGLTPWLNHAPWVDIIACNPPCLPGNLVDDCLAGSLKIAMQGNHGGISLLVEMMESLEHILTPHGRFVFLMTSIMDFKSMARILNTRYAGRWRVSPGMPIAAPYCRSSDPMVATLLAMRNTGEVFVWLGNDGWLWRLTWVVAILGTASLRNDALADSAGTLDFYPFGHIPVTEDYLRTLEIFGCAPPSNPTPQRNSTR